MRSRSWTLTSYKSRYEPIIACLGSNAILVSRHGLSFFQSGRIAPSCPLSEAISSGVKGEDTGGGKASPFAGFFYARGDHKRY